MTNEQTPQAEALEALERLRVAHLAWLESLESLKSLEIQPSRAEEMATLYLDLALPRPRPGLTFNQRGN